MFFALISVVLALVSPALAWAADYSAIKSEGVAARMDDKGEVKRRALDQALKKAVVEALGDMLEKESMSVSPAVIDANASNPRAYINNYKILAEGWVNHTETPQLMPESFPEAALQNAGGLELYHIWIEASVNASQLRGAVGRIISQGEDNLNEIRINIMDIPDYATYRSLVGSLKRITVIKDITYDSFYNGRVVLTARAAASPQTLSERIAREVEGGFAVIPSGSYIVIKAAPKPRTLE